MVNYKPWSLEQFGTNYLANANIVGVDVGKASAGSDEVEHMFGVFLERYEDIANEAAENYSDLREWVEIFSSLTPSAHLDNAVRKVAVLTLAAVSMSVLQRVLQKNGPPKG